MPVLLDRVTELLAPAAPADGAVLVDGTLGHGRPRRGDARALPPGPRSIGLDRDRARPWRSRGERLAPFGDRLTLVPAVYDEIADVLAGLGAEEVQGVLFDLGVSSLQLDRPTAGSATAQTRPLDMRMDRRSGRTAADVLNTYPPGTSPASCATYGEERFASRIAAAIVRERAREPFTHARAARRAAPRRPSRRRRGAPAGHPAKRTFQALRIEVNDELGVLGARAAGRDRRARRRAAGSPSSPTTRSRTGSSSGPRRRGRAAGRRPECRSRCPSTRPTCAC